MINCIDTETLRRWQHEGREFVLIDTLPSESFAGGHLPGAINIVSDNILTQAPKRLPNMNAIIVVYCASAKCKRAALAAERLENLGYCRIFHYQGGKKDWTAAKLPLEANS